MVKSATRHLEVSIKEVSLREYSKTGPGSNGL